LFYRSASTYKFLRDQQILPLPCARTIRRYLSLTKTGCGFDSNLKKKLSTMKDEEKHGILIFDEIS